VKTWGVVRVGFFADNKVMFVCPCYREKNGKRHAYWALVESYRSERGPRQRVISYLGQLDERGRLGVKCTAEGYQGTRQRELFEDTEPEWVEVDIRRVRVEGCVDFGGPWLGRELLRKLKLGSFFEKRYGDMSRGWWKRFFRGVWAIVFPGDGDELFRSVVL